MLGPGKRNGSHYSFHKHRQLPGPPSPSLSLFQSPAPHPGALPCPRAPAPYPQVAVGDVRGWEGGVERLFPVDFNDAPVLDITARRGRAVSRHPASTGSLPAPGLHPRPPCCLQTTDVSVFNALKETEISVRDPLRDARSGLRHQGLVWLSRDEQALPAVVSFEGIYPPQALCFLHHFQGNPSPLQGSFHPCWKGRHRTMTAGSKAANIGSPLRWMGNARCCARHPVPGASKLSRVCARRNVGRLLFPA